MNLVLFEEAEVGLPLPLTDPRAVHLLGVLRRGVGDGFDAGVVNGPRGRGTLLSVGAGELHLGFEWGPEPEPLDPITLIVGLPRPQTARKMLQEAAALGVRAMHFIRAGKGESNYAQSVLWHSGEWRRHLMAGAAQAFHTRLPEVSHGRPLARALDEIETGSTRLALDNYEAGRSLSASACSPPVVLALGPERGWSADERDLFRARDFELVHLGSRVLRAETACVAAVAIVKAKLGRM